MMKKLLFAKMGVSLLEMSHVLCSRKAGFTGPLCVTKFKILCKMWKIGNLFFFFFFFFNLDLMECVQKYLWEDGLYRLFDHSIFQQLNTLYQTPKLSGPYAQSNLNQVQIQTQSKWRLVLLKGTFSLSFISILSPEEAT